MTVTWVSMRCVFLAVYILYTLRYMIVHTVCCVTSVDNVYCMCLYTLCVGVLVCVSE